MYVFFVRMVAFAVVAMSVHAVPAIARGQTCANGVCVPSGPAIAAPSYAPRSVPGVVEYRSGYPGAPFQEASYPVIWCPCMAVAPAIGQYSLSPAPSYYTPASPAWSPPSYAVPTSYYPQPHFYRHVERRAWR